MEVFLLIAAIIAVFLIYPYVRIFLKRLSLWKKLRRICHKKGFTLIPTHRCWIFGRKLGKQCDFYIETRETVFAVKLFGMKKRGQILFFGKNSDFFVRSFIGFLAITGNGVLIPVDSKVRPIPNYDFRIGFKNEWYLKSIRPVLLLNPACHEVRLKKDDKEEIIGNNEAVAGMTLFTLARFLGELEDSL